MPNNENEEDEFMGQTDDENPPVHEDMENDGEYQGPPSVDPTTPNEKEWDCPWCDNGFDNLKSLTGHVLGKSRHDNIHDYQEFRLQYADKLQSEKKKATGKSTIRKKSRAPSGSSAVKLTPVHATFDPAEEDEVVKLKKEIERLKLEKQRQALYDGSGRKDRDDHRSQEENQMYGLLRDMINKDQGSGKDDKSYDEMKFWRDLAMQNSNDYKKSLEGQNKELIGEIKELRSDVENLSKDDRRYGPIDEELTKATVKAVNTFTDIFGSSWKHNIKEMSRFQKAAQSFQTGTPPDEIPEIAMREDGGGKAAMNEIIRRVNPRIVVEE